MAERLINATVNIERFLPEIPRFFGSFNAILTELMQNAYRAGATEVEAEINIGERLLTIQDNGIGVEDPQSLLSVGDTGWDEDRVIDPAGMGAFAALRPEFVKQVEYESHGKKSWRMIVKQDVLNGGAAVLKELHSNGKTGLSVTGVDPISWTPLCYMKGVHNAKNTSSISGRISKENDRACSLRAYSIRAFQAV